MIKGFLTIKHGHEEIGTLHIDLHDEIVPRTVQNFRAILQGTGSLTFRNSISHRLIPGFMAQFGDITKGDGTGGVSIFGESFEDENFILKHDRKGVLSMANAGKDTNGSQFFVTFKTAPFLDGKHVVFGYVNLEKSRFVLRKLEDIKTDSNDKPLKPVIIVDCGVVLEENENGQGNTLPVSTDRTSAAREESTEQMQEEEEEEDTSNMTHSQVIKNRLRKLKMKMNQARQLNHKALLNEGEAMMNGGGKASRKGQNKADKKADTQAYSLVESAASSMVRFGRKCPTWYIGWLEGWSHLTLSSAKERAEKRAERKEKNKYDVTDYVNPEAQHIRYERNAKAIPRDVSETTTTADPSDAVMNPVDVDKEREGARRLANDMHRRIEKARIRKRNKLEFEETDVSYINQRNKRFNQKISRDYDQATAEIKQNLERGTAL
jgi:peptidyl-prolyl cis-trans isomerase B (cyclophilin B)